MIEPEQCEELEWILPLGTGGYSSSTICGMNSRTYHGLLVSPQNPPHMRFVILSKLEDSLIVRDEEYPISTNRYNFNVYHPEGYKFLQSFIRGGNFVSWIYNLPGATLRKTLIANKGTNSITLIYESDKGKIKLCPLITYRSHHLALKSRPGFFDYKIIDNNLIKILYNNKEIINFELSNPAKILSSGYWYYNFFYRLDYERGENFLEDLYNPFCLESIGNTFQFTVYQGEYKRSSIVHLKKDIIPLLSYTSKDFVVKGKYGWAIIAGYHWFDEWGRDTFISMEGLLFLNALYDIARNIINRYFSLLEKGMLPNNFLYNDEPVYLGIDISLWAINTIYKYFIYTNDTEFIKSIFQYLVEIVENYWKGNGIVHNYNGLIFHKGYPRTWMDAQYSDESVTPREGAAVEVNALWYNALMIMDFLSSFIGYNEYNFKEMANQVKSSFSMFYAENGLYDFLDWNLRPDHSIRPNQLFAISLPYSPIEEKKAKETLLLIERELLRPYGLSTLSKKDPRYIPYYRGNRESRDKAYHNGPIWPWLIGSYIDAKIKLEKNPIKIKTLLNNIEPLLNVAINNAGYIPEIFEDIPPYRQAGCIAQAWSISETFRSVNNILNYS
ncbi:amylo-alpha-1,6-glucosidase [Acidianus sp. RZ1]|uniref:amylo-alpha-1,6-glucosidase n=1 Tax=Acidianus sp. RZ1 TaxID=1540082 RepID=UPI001491B078|nr:amylo-alpha-1,6-glucosidase [Acidianus sp. RZ1]NON62952.1 glycogen debranching protein [Acidianus sp. RZ1]